MAVLDRAGDSDSERNQHVGRGEHERRRQTKRRDDVTPQGKAPSDKPALEPYWGKPAVRNLRGDDGNVGIIRSPVRAIVLPDSRQGITNGASWSSDVFWPLNVTEKCLDHKTSWKSVDRPKVVPVESPCVQQPHRPADCGLPETALTIADLHVGSRPKPARDRSAMPVAPGPGPCDSEESLTKPHERQCAEISTSQARWPSRTKVGQDQPWHGFPVESRYFGPKWKVRRIFARPVPISAQFEQKLPN